MRFMHHRSGLEVQVLCLLSAVLVVQGCLSKTPPPGVRFPITSGSHTILPTAQQRILIWGDPPYDRFGRGMAPVPSLLGYPDA